MLKILHKSQAPCFQCGKSKNTAQVKGPNFSLVLCIEHVWQHIPENPKKEEAPNDNGGT